MTAIDEYKLVAEIRDITQHTSNNIDSETGITAIENTFHPNGLYTYERVTMMVFDDHNQDYTLNVEVTHHGDSDYSESVVYDTIDFSATSGKLVELPTPVGKVRLVTKTGALTTAPTAGSLTVVMVGHRA